MRSIFKRERARTTLDPATLLVVVVAALLLVLQSAACGNRNEPTNEGARASNASSKERARARRSQEAARNERAEAEDSANVEASASAETDEKDAALASEIDRIIDAGDLSFARWGVAVVSLRDGRIVYARDAESLFTPASVMKLYTTAVALDLLGADYRWRTSVYADAEPNDDGVIRGNLTLYGRGSPDLSARGADSDFAALADALYRRGIRRVRGDVVGDESYFRGEALGAGWLWEDAQWYYGAEPSALSVDGNEITVSISPAGATGQPVDVKVVPQTDYVRVTNDARTVERGARPALGVTRSLSSNDVRVWGEFPAGGAAFGVRLSVQRPALWAARLFREALRARGIEVRGEARVRDARDDAKKAFDPSKSDELAYVLSEPLGEAAREVNKESLNLQAELILRTLGVERGSYAPEPDPRRERTRDADAAGAAILRRWLEQAGIETRTLALHDGSGLSRLNLVTPKATARLLARMSGSPEAEAFRASLPVAGRDGTLRGRLQSAPAESSVQAKTGTLTYVNGLAGYARAADGEPLAFAIFSNDKTLPQSSVRLIDEIVLALTRRPAPEN